MSAREAKKFIISDAYLSDASGLAAVVVEALILLGLNHDKERL